MRTAPPLRQNMIASPNNPDDYYNNIINDEHLEPSVEECNFVEYSPNNELEQEQDFF